MILLSLNPVATPLTTTTFYVTAIYSPVCQVKDSVLINVRDPNTVSVNPPKTICNKDTTMLLAQGGDTYSWTPGNFTIANPTVYPSASTDYSVVISDTVCQVSNTLFTTVNINPLPQIHAN